MIGLLPAAGQAARMNGLPKYLLPIADGNLLEKHISDMCIAPVDQILIMVDAPTARLTAVEYPAVFCHAPQHQTMNETLLSAKSFGSSDTWLMGMPDTFIEDKWAYSRLFQLLNKTDIEVAVGLFCARPGQHTKVGMCRVDGKRVTEVIDRPAETDLWWLWGMLAWQPVFWEYIKPEDPHVGYALPRAIAAGLDVRAVKMDGRYWDCGTPEEYFECIREITG